MDAVRKIQFHGGLTCLLVDFYFIDISRAKSCARVLVLFLARGITDVELRYLEMGWLLLLVDCA